MRRLVRCTLCLSAACGAGLAPVAAQGAGSGVGGTVTLWPTQPGPQRRGEAGTAPFADATIELRDARGRPIATSRTDAAGRFRIPARPGRSEVRARIHNSPLPRCDSVQAVVQAQQTVDVTIACDSGLR